MKKIITLIFFIYIFNIIKSQISYDKIWEIINNNINSESKHFFFDFNNLISNNYNIRKYILHLEYFKNAYIYLFLVNNLDYSNPSLNTFEKFMDKLFEQFSKKSCFNENSIFIFISSLDKQFYINCGDNLLMNINEISKNKIIKILENKFNSQQLESNILSLLDSIGDLVKIDYWDNYDGDEYIFNFNIKDYYNETNSYINNQEENKKNEENEEKNNIIIKINKNYYIKKYILYCLIIIILFCFSYYIFKKIKKCNNKNVLKNGIYEKFNGESELEIKY